MFMIRSRIEWHWFVMYFGGGCGMSCFHYYDKQIGSILPQYWYLTVNTKLINSFLFFIIKLYNYLVKQLS